MQQLRLIGASGWASLVGAALGTAAACLLLVVAARAPRHARPVRNRASVAAPLNAPSGGLQDQLNRLLADTLGPHSAYVVADVLTNGNRVSAQQLSYGRRGTALQSQSALARGNGAGYNYRRRAGAASWGHDERLTTTVFAPGAIRRIQLTLVANAKLPRRTVGRLRRMVASFAGLNRSRGDRITVARLPLGANSASPAPTGLAALVAAADVQQTLTIGRWALLALGVVGFLIIARRDIRRGRRP